MKRCPLLGKKELAYSVKKSVYANLLLDNNKNKS